MRFKFKSRPDGGLRFEKICDGRVRRSLEGNISLAAVNPETTRVLIALDGSARALVPEFTIKARMKEQLQQMTRALRARPSKCSRAFRGDRATHEVSLARAGSGPPLLLSTPRSRRTCTGPTEEALAASRAW